MNTSRRTFIQHGTAAGFALASGGLVATRVSFAATAATPQRFVFVILRGALDGLAAVPPIGDPDYARQRGQLVLSTNAAGDGLLRLDGTFALHPALAGMAQRWQERQLAVIHAVATPYRERSHFDAQDVLETGFERPHASRSGWLNRALAALPAAATGTAHARHRGIALGASIPLVMRGEVDVASWSASRLPDVDSDTMQRIADLYAGDPVLSMRLADALAAQELAGSDSARAGRGLAAQIAETAQATARFLAQEEGPRIAVFETSGWDTHANQGAGEGPLALRLAALDAGLARLRDALGPVWENTVVLVATEFGRTVAVNGTRGTDHGTGSAAFLLGGAVSGGRVIAQWPGLSPGSLHEGRDLRPTTDLRSVIKSVLCDHLAIPERRVETEVFPDSRAAPCIDGLVRHA